MEFDNSFEVPLPPAQAWPVLMDIQRIAPCMPGAELTEVVDDKTYKGKIARAARPGRAHVCGHGGVRGDRQRQPQRPREGAGDRRQGPRRRQCHGRRSGLNRRASGSKVLVHTDLALSGSVAQYGRGVGMIQATAAQIMNQFAE